MEKIVIVTGGTSGLGLEMTKKFLSIGYNVAVIGRNVAKLKNLEQISKQFVGKLCTYIGDITDEMTIDSIVKTITKHYQIEYLINNAGSFWACHFSENTKEKLDDVMSCVIGAMICTAKVLPYMKKVNSGKIVNIMSSAALLGRPLESMYCCAKYATKGFNNSLTHELKGTNIKVVGVYPGGINTQFYERTRDYTPKSVSDKFMDPAKLAEVVVNNCLQIDTLNVSSIKIDRL